MARKGSGDDQGTDRGDDALVNIMRRLAGGDQAAVVTLYERYGGPIAAAVRRTARSRPGRLDRDDVDGLVFEVCFELAAVAAAWSPAGGALPWVWARHRVANAVDRVLGIVVEPLDDARLPGPDSVAADAGADDLVAGAGARAGTESLLDTLGQMAPDMASASLLAEAIDRGRVSRRDGALLLEYAYEKHSGNVSPAATVAPVFGMKEVSVRQAARRARHRLLRLAATEERFAPLADLPLLA